MCDHLPNPGKSSLKREVILEAKDMANERRAKRSMIKVGKLFTMHGSLVAARFGAVKEEKLLMVLK